EAKTGLLKKIGDTALARKRFDFWLDEDRADLYQTAYSASLHAARFFEAIATFHPEGITDQEQFIDAYVGSWQDIDRHYRLYFEAVLSLTGIDFFTDISVKIQIVYREQFLSRLAARWIPLSATPEGTIQKWKMPHVRSQNDFYAKEVEPCISSGPNRRIYVVISDALRYEVGAELTEALSCNPRLSASIKPMVTNLPSITKIGMSALLPGTERSFPDPDTLLIDGISTQGMEMRNKILSRSNGLAIGADELLSMKREDARALQKNASIVYVYHDSIDAAGDKASSEDATFTACRTACTDLEKIVKFIMNTMNGSSILITADHGFIYTTDSVSEAQRSSVVQEVPGATVNKKRYKLGQMMHPCPGGITGSCSEFGFPGSPVQFMVPKGIQLFHFVGGAKFFHGGMMPQEIIVPLITVKTDNDALKNEQRKEPAETGVLGLPATITTRVVSIRL
ncbi:MAG TPA: BREX-1 system phosphatase PglZ type A, partial [Treponemataceae bacterium]|nr:BREX-1 system phosphatase PglZ type A [Treponemataceae bacterium]